MLQGTIAKIDVKFNAKVNWNRLLCKLELLTVILDLHGKPKLFTKYDISRNTCIFLIFWIECLQWKLKLFYDKS